MRRSFASVVLNVVATLYAQAQEKLIVYLENLTMYKAEGDEE